MRQSHDNVDVPSKFSYLETGSLRLEQNEEDDYEDNDMNEYDQMNDEFKDVDEVMGDTTNNGTSTSQIKTVKLNDEKKELHAIIEPQRLKNNEDNEDNEMNEEFKDVDEVMGDTTKNGASTSQIKTVKLDGQTPSNLSGYKKRSIELDLGNDVTSQGTTI
jgi:hypothetical protein